MHEEQTVSFQPIGYEGHIPWFVNLFVIYLLYVLLATVASAVRVMWTLRKDRKAEESEAPVESSSQDRWEVCHSKIRSIRNLSHLTFLLGALVLSWSTINILAGVSTAKAPSFPFVAAELAQALVPFAMGIIFCSGQFCCAMFLENRVRHSRHLLDRKLNKPQPSAE
jgi:hypothetical protein